ncbi:MAG TPA: hypothetical protein VNZ05_05460, partial [Solirubrobacteraceae bacterium]|nr:hypothetical protein [Solirubrobacteraceae bacterium]
MALAAMPRQLTPPRVARSSTACALGGTLLACALLAMALPSRAGAQGVDAERALAAYAAMQQHYYLPYHHLYRGEETESAQEYAYLWPYSQA